MPFENARGQYQGVGCVLRARCHCRVVRAKNEVGSAEAAQLMLGAQAEQGDDRERGAGTGTADQQTSAAELRLRVLRQPEGRSFAIVRCSRIWVFRRESVLETDDRQLR